MGQGDGGASVSLYDLVSERPGGARAIAAARLRRRVVAILHRAFLLSDVNSQSALAKKLNIRKSAVSQVFRSDGNLRINTLAEYLYELGFEVDLELIEAGELRRAAIKGSMPGHPHTISGSFALSLTWGSAGFTVYPTGEPVPGLRITCTETRSAASSGSSTLTAELVTQ
jgi:transcriptional regulator with XRE-family HTH domain